MEQIFKVSLKGTYLPSIGGISTHISRLAALLHNEKVLGTIYSMSTPSANSNNKFNVNTEFANHKYTIIQSISWCLKCGLRDNSRIFHIHGNPIWEAPTILVLVIFQKKVVFTIHDQLMLNDVSKYPKFLKLILRLVVRSKNIHWIFVNKNIKNQFRHIKKVFTNYSIIPAYIPSNINNEVKILENVIMDFVKSKSKVFTVYAHSVRFINCHDLYGIDLALKATSIILKTYPRCGLIVLVSNIKDERDVEYYQQIIENLQIRNNVLLFKGPVIDPICLWKISNIVIRPTLSDGDSVMVREALQEGVPVIASDCVKRPEGSILFRSGDYEDLSEKILNTLGTANMQHGQPSNSNYNRIMCVYLKLMNHR